MDEKLSRGALVAITVLRVFVGWHFLYEGLTKLNSAGWSAGSPRTRTCSTTRTRSRCGA